MQKTRVPRKGGKNDDAKNLVKKSDFDLFLLGNFRFFDHFLRKNTLIWSFFIMDFAAECKNAHLSPCGCVSLRLGKSATFLKIPALETLQNLGKV